MSKRRRVWAVAPDGRVHTRQSASRIYTHAIFGRAGFGSDPDMWRICGYASSHELADKAVRRYLGKTWGWREALAVEVTDYDPRQS